MSIDRHQRRARRLVRWYPPVWRERYGDEFTELLTQDLEDRARSFPVVLDVARGAFVARVRESGLGESALDEAQQIAASLRALVWSLAAVLLVGMTVWSQVAVGWRWEPPNSTAVAVAMVTMSIAAAALGALAVGALLPLSWAVGRAVRRDNRELRRAALLTVSSAVLLLVGCRHFAGGWPGTGGHAWSHQGFVPAGLASFGWAATRGLTAYWAHPTALTSFPIVELVWMAASPVALAGLVIGAVRTVRHVDLTPRMVRYEFALGLVAVVTSVVLLAGAAVWVLDNGTPGPTGIYRVGMIDVVALAVMVMACAVASRAALRGRAALPA